MADSGFARSTIAHYEVVIANPGATKYFKLDKRRVLLLLSIEETGGPPGRVAARRRFTVLAGFEAAYRAYSAKLEARGLGASTRFLARTGLCGPEVPGAAPLIPGHKHSTMPSAYAAADVSSTVSGFPSSLCPKRDRAILLLDAVHTVLLSGRFGPRSPPQSKTLKCLGWFHELIARFT